MLTRIIVNNINAIEHCDVSFVRNKYQYLNEMIYQDKIINPAAFYGANGSGKSSLLSAISYLISMLIHSPDDMLEFIPNYISATKFLEEENGKDIQNDEHTQNQPLNKFISSIEIFFTLEGNEYRYYLATNPYQTIVDEKLYVNEQNLLSRDVKTYSYQKKTMPINSERFPALRSISKDEESSFVKRAYDFLSDMAFIDAGKKKYLHKTLIEKRSKDLLVEKSDDVNNVLKQYKEFPLYKVIAENNRELATKYYFDLEIENDSYYRLPLSFMSDGMYNNSMMLSLLLSLPENGVLFIDEIECALHPLTIMDFISIVRQKNIQLIFSSHNTFLLQNLRPDQIFFAHWSKGSSKYKRLSDIYPSIRAINNIEKMYLANLFEEDIKK